MNRIGVMQGRLTPPEGDRIQFFPKEGWAEEFTRAQKAGLDVIEWIYDVDGDDFNPIATRQGLLQLKSLTRETGVEVVSVCADYFMTETLVQGTPEACANRKEKLHWLMQNCHELGVRRIILPFVDSSKIAKESQRLALIQLLRQTSPLAQQLQLELHLETDLPPLAFAELLKQIDCPEVKINYDSGNSASHGYKIEEEFSAYGNFIGSVHIKDRLLKGGTVPLGQGHVDFTALRKGLVELDYQSEFILQVARNTPGDELAWARHNIEFVRHWWEGNP